MEIDQFITLFLEQKAEEMEEFKAGFEEGEEKSRREWEIAFGIWILDKYSTPLSED
jgi:hypothetical protein